MEERNTVFEFLQYQVEHQPDVAAYLSPDRKEATYRHIYEQVLKARISFDRSGIEPHARVGLLINDPSDFAVAMIAVSSGAISVPLSPAIPEGEAARLFKLLKLENIISDLDERSPLITAAIESGVRPVFIESQPESPCGTFRLISAHRKDSCSWGFNTKDDISLILQSSGSTAVPKLIPIKENSIAKGFFILVEKLNITTNDRYLNFMPFTHGAGLLGGIVSPLVFGAGSVLTKGYIKPMLIQWLKKYNITYVFTSPSLYKDILRGEDEREITAQLKNTNLRIILTGSAPITNNFGLRLEKVFSVPLIQFYGMTEAFAITLNTANSQRTGSVGKPFCLEMGVFNDDNILCEPFKTGLIKIKGDLVFPGYLDDEKTNSEVFHNGWFTTGDMGWLDDDGYLYLTGRVNEIINKGAEKISPEEVETWINNYPAVHESVVFGMPHPVLGHDIAAVVVPKAGINNIDVTDLKMFLLKELSDYKIPSQIMVTDKLPMTESGKIERKKVYDLVKLRLSPVQDDKLKARPVTPVQQYVYDKFREILQTDEFGIDDDFMALGGTSFNVAQLLSHVEKDINDVIHVVSFMKAPTVSKFSEVLETRYSQSLDKILKINQNRAENVNYHVSEADISIFTKHLPAITYEPARIVATSVSPVFILCTSRSGSTLLRVILAGNSGLFSPPELRLMNYNTLNEWKADLTGEYSFYQEGLLRAVMSAFGIGTEEAREWIEERLREKVRVEQVYEMLQNVIGSERIIVDKSPTYGLDAGVLRKMELVFQKPKYIHLLRNPSDMKSSYGKLHMDQLWNYDHQFRGSQLGELIWYSSHRNIRNFLQEIPADRKTSVYYEDLVQNPGEIAGQLCSFTGVPYEDDMLRIYDDQEKRMTNPAVKGSKMIGDPLFFEYPGIGSKGNETDFILGADVCEPVRLLASKLGYHSPQTMEKSLHTFKHE